MSVRQLTVLGTAAGVPTRHRNHNGYVLHWDDELVLFDPGEGTQRQMLHADVSAARVTRICITHFHGDHSFGLPGVLLTRAVNRPDDPVPVHFPAAAQEHFDHLTRATVSGAPTWARGCPTEPGQVADAKTFSLHAAALDHRVPALGWRIEEPPGRRMLPERLEAVGITGPAIGRLVREGAMHVDGRWIGLDDVSVPRVGQRFAFVMDTRLCDAAYALADRADLLVCEATFLERDAALAHSHGHLTAAQAGLLAAEAGVRRLVLTHFSQRYGDDAAPFREEAAQHFADVVTVDDLDTVEVPPRRED